MSPGLEKIMVTLVKSVLVRFAITALHFLANVLVDQPAGELRNYRLVSKAYPFRLISLLAVLAIAAPLTRAQTCGTPGKDGTPASPITGIVNTYYPGTANVSAGNTSITLGPATGATTAITSGDLLIVIQMQDASINSSNNSRYGDGVNGDPGSGYSNPNGVGRYEFVKATNTVALTGGTLSLTGTGPGGGLINAYNTTAVAGQGQRRFQVVRVPQYVTATLGAALTAKAWDGSTGGVLALDIRDSFLLNNNTMSVAGLGFRGGAGLQLVGSGGSNGDYRNTAPASATTTVGFHGSKGRGLLAHRATYGTREPLRLSIPA